MAAQQGFTQTFVLQGGLPVWEEHGYPVYAGPNYETNSSARLYSAQQVQELLQNQAANLQLIDVREATEFADKHIPGAINLPMTVLRARMNELDRGKTIILYCISGGRSYTAIRHLRKFGFSNVGHVTLEDWERAGLPLIRP